MRAIYEKKNRDWALIISLIVVLVIVIARIYLLLSVHLFHGIYTDNLYDLFYGLNRMGSYYCVGMLLLNLSRQKD